MEDVCGGKRPFLGTAHLESEHLRCVDKAIYVFQNKRKMGGDEFSLTYMEKLKKVLILPIVLDIRLRMISKEMYKYTSSNETSIWFKSKILI